MLNLDLCTKKIGKSFAMTPLSTVNNPITIPSSYIKNYMNIGLIAILVMMCNIFSLQTAKDLFVCVSNINPETDEETFSNFLEGRAGGDAEVICVVFSEDKSTAVVEFSSPVGKLSH